MPSTPTTYTLDLSKAHKDIRSGHLRQGGSSPYGDAIEVNSYYLSLNGRPFFGVSGEFFVGCHSRASFRFVFASVGLALFFIIFVY